MLIITESYIPIDEIINEDFNEDDAEKLKQAILADDSRELLDSKDIIDYKDAVIDQASDNFVSDNDSYKEFFSRHGIDSLKDDIVRLFAKNGHIEVLNDIVKRDGSFDLAGLVGNNNLKNLVSKFKSEAEKIANFAPKSLGKSIGKFEVLLRFAIIEGGSPGDRGDVKVGNSTSIEVKGENSRPEGYSSRYPEVIFRHIDEVFSSSGIVIDNPGEENYTTSKFKQFTNRLKEYLSKENSSIDTIIKAINNGVAKQYNTKPDNDVIKKISNGVDLYDQQQLKDLIGRLQIYYYHISDKWNYLIFIYNSKWDYIILNEENIISQSKKIIFEGQDMTKKAAKMHIKSR